MRNRCGIYAARLRRTAQRRGDFSRPDALGKPIVLTDPLAKTRPSRQTRFLPPLRSGEREVLLSIPPPDLAGAIIHRASPSTTANNSHEVDHNLGRRSSVSARSGSRAVFNPFSAPIPSRRTNSSSACLRRPLGASRQAHAHYETRRELLAEGRGNQALRQHARLVGRGRLKAARRNPCRSRVPCGGAAIIYALGISRERYELRPLLLCGTTTITGMIPMTWSPGATT